MRMTIYALVVAAVLTAPAARSQGTPVFQWPEGKQAAVSLTFDDARVTQPSIGATLFARFKTKATFYVVPARMEPHLDGWKRLAAAGHEIANHTLTHPCSGNFPFSRERALEDYSLEKMRFELTESNRLIEKLLGVKATSFAYPCGQTFVGRGRESKSYVPLVADIFQSGRTWLDEAANDPRYVDLARITGIETDGKSFDDLKPQLDDARKNGLWLVFGGHEINASGGQTTRVGMLEQLVPYLEDPANGFWAAPVGTVADYVLHERAEQR